MAPVSRVRRARESAASVAVSLASVEAVTVRGAARAVATRVADPRGLVAASWRAGFGSPRLGADTRGRNARRGIAAARVEDASRAPRAAVTAAGAGAVHPRPDMVASAPPRGFLAARR